MLNRLYATAMCYPHPISDFRWMTEEEILNYNVYEGGDLNNSHGYFLEVDLEYPENLHLSHNSFPLAPETVDITFDDLSPYSKRCLKALGRGVKYNSRKLTATFRPRKKYLVHGANLKFYTEKGLILTKIHRGITFRQQRFLEPFITLCQKKRMGAATKIESTMWKLVCNCVYGKVRR